MKSQQISVTEAAKQKKVSRSAIYKAIEAGRLSSQRVLGLVALEQSEVTDWQPQGRVGRRKGTAMSAEAKQKISDGQKRRWQKRKSE